MILPFEKPDGQRDSSRGFGDVICEFSAPVRRKQNGIVLKETYLAGTVYGAAIFAKIIDVPGDVDDLTRFVFSKEYAGTASLASATKFQKPISKMRSSIYGIQEKIRLEK